MKKNILIFGGTGFIGRYVVYLFAKEGHHVTVITRNPENALSARTYGKVGQVKIQKGNPLKTIEKKWFDQKDIIINTIGSLNTRSSGAFLKIHQELPKALAEHAKKAGIKKFIHISAVGANSKSDSIYLKSKALGEEAVFKTIPKAVVLRPSLVFGEEDRFFNLLANLRAVTPFMPVIAGGHARFQPCYVKDLAQAIYNSVLNDDIKGIFELCGPDQFSLKEMIEMVCAIHHRKTFLIHVPSLFAKIGARLLQLMPNPILTPAMINLLNKDNVCSGKYPGFGFLNIHPRSLSNILPTYIVH